jgi:hypothetical protein
MRYAVALVAAALVATLVIVGTATGSHQAVQAKKLSTTLTGAEEVPPADPDGSGLVNLKLMPKKGKICYEFTVMNVATITAAHIHKAPAGMNGSVVVTLSPVPPDADDGHWTGCATGLDPALVKDIVKNHAGYYVNVHNTQFPSGAMRGQLD